MDVIRDYAKRRGLEIVKEYSDEGKNGLNIQGRDSLAQMLRDVQNSVGNHSCILVYDVSRWGRFQDADESAYYEYICRHAGVAVHYCAEQFENDGSPVSTIVTLRAERRTRRGATAATGRAPRPCLAKAARWRSRCRATGTARLSRA